FNSSTVVLPSCPPSAGRVPLRRLANRVFFRRRRCMLRSFDSPPRLAAQDRGADLADRRYMILCRRLPWPHGGTLVPSDPGFVQGGLARRAAGLVVASKAPHFNVGAVLCPRRTSGQGRAECSRCRYRVVDLFENKATESPLARIAPPPR